MSKLIAYFSASGVTAKAVKSLASQIGADTYEIAASPIFSEADLDWTNKNSRCYKEMHDDACRPPLAKPIPDVSKYSDIVIAFPIWWGVEPRQVDTFLDNIDISGKKTHGVSNFRRQPGRTLRRSPEKTLSQRQLDWMRSREQRQCRILGQTARILIQAPGSKSSGNHISICPFNARFHCEVD